MAWSLCSDGSYQRLLGDSEYALFLGSQAALGDMFLHLGFRAPTRCFRAERVQIAWSVIRGKNPLLMSKVVLDDDNLSTARFSFSPPSTSQSAIQEARAALRFGRETKEDLISAYMDGPRILSNDYLSYLIISGPEVVPDPDHELAEYDLLMCAPHFIGDGTALHQSTHELLRLVTSDKTDVELAKYHDAVQNWAETLPLSVESRLSIPASAFARAACKINYIQTLSREIGGHTFSRIQRGAKKTVLQECEFSAAQTAAILANCKTNGVTVNHALTALCNVAWARCTSQSLELPMLFYTAANLRPHLAPQPSTSHWFLALAYFTMSFPAFAPTNTSGVWHRARLAKTYMQRAVRSPLLPTRALLSAAGRARRTPASGFVPPPESPALPSRPAASAALLGISLIGDLDRTYVRTAYGPGVHLHTVATASRLKPGGLLLLGHSFGGRLVLQLCWDSMGFAEGEIECFWATLTGAVTEFLC